MINAYFTHLKLDGCHNGLNYNSESPNCHRQMRFLSHGKFQKCICNVKAINGNAGFKKRFYTIVYDYTVRIPRTYRKSCINIASEI